MKQECRLTRELTRQLTLKGLLRAFLERRIAKAITNVRVPYIIVSVVAADDNMT